MLYFATTSTFVWTPKLYWQLQKRHTHPYPCNDKFKRFVLGNIAEMCDNLQAKGCLKLVDIRSSSSARRTSNSRCSWRTCLKTFPLDNHRTSAWYSNLIASASMCLSRSENIQCFFECEQIKFTIFTTSSRTISRPDRWLFSSINLLTIWEPGYDIFVLWFQPKTAVFGCPTNALAPPLIALESCSRAQPDRLA